jgi:hypothetical protein
MNLEEQRKELRELFDFPESKYKIKGLVFKNTSPGCPEQYDVFQKDKQVGYIRYRWGNFRIDCPNCGDKEIYSEEIDEDGYEGMLNENRMKYLKLATKLILKEIKCQSQK